MKKKYVLKKWVKVTLHFIGVIAFVTLFAWAISEGLDNYDEAGKQCDEYYGYTCSHYQVEQWIRGVRY